MVRVGGCADRRGRMPTRATELNGEVSTPLHTCTPNITTPTFTLVAESRLLYKGLNLRVFVMPKIFISYRRDDSFGYAQTIYSELVRHFSKDQVFMDVDTVEPGVDFVDVIEKAVGECDVLVALIGNRWANVRK